MASRKAAVDPQQNISQLLRFDPQIVFDPVPWPILERLDRSILQQAMQVQLELHQTMLEARLDATKRMNSILKGR